MVQNQIQNPEAIFSGQGRLWVGTDFESLDEVGLIRNLKIKHKITVQEIAVDGVESLKYYQNGKKYALEFELGEITPQFWQVVNNGLLTIDTQNITMQSSGIAQGSVARFRYTNDDEDTLTIDLENVVNIKTLGIEMASSGSEIAFQEVELEGDLVSINDQINL